MAEESDNAIDEIIKNLDRIPKEISTEIFVSKIEDELFKKLRRKIAL
jgi:hypothetical protein